jgi:hypothetical protein
MKTIAQIELVKPMSPRSLPRGFRKGMWVFHDEVGVGIVLRVVPVSVATGEEIPRDELQRYLPNTVRLYADVDLVGENGETTLGARSPAEDWRQAVFEEIPESRRPTKEVAIALGYLVR